MKKGRTIAIAKGLLTKHKYPVKIRGLVLAYFCFWKHMVLFNLDEKKLTNQFTVI